MKALDLGKKTTEELQAELLSQLEEQFRLRMQRATGQLEQTHLMKQVRRNIARIKTVLGQKENS